MRVCDCQLCKGMPMVNLRVQNPESFVESVTASCARECPWLTMVYLRVQKPEGFVESLRLPVVQGSAHGLLAHLRKKNEYAST